MFNTAAEKEAARGNVEREYSTLRDNLEKQYIADKNALEQEYQKDVQAYAAARSQALLAAGLNSDGSDPQGRPTG